MNNRYIEREPDNSFQDFCEAVDDQFSYWFFLKNEAFLDSEICFSWYEKLFAKDANPDDAAEIIERAFKLYKL
jgi:hypothetical protein